MIGYCLLVSWYPIDPFQINRGTIFALFSLLQHVKTNLNVMQDKPRAYASGLILLGQTPSGARKRLKGPIPVLEELSLSPQSEKQWIN